MASIFPRLVVTLISPFVGTTLDLCPSLFVNLQRRGSARGWKKSQVKEDYGLVSLLSFSNNTALYDFRVVTQVTCSSVISCQSADKKSKITVSSHLQTFELTFLALKLLKLLKHVFN